jgi:CheY-like chemotaxis protein
MPLILVVDDSPVDRTLTGRLLEKEKNLDWVVEYAENGREAFTLMQDLLPDVVVTDLLMPEMDGLELVAAVRAKYPQIPVILVTGQGSEELAFDALARGAASFVPKGQLGDKLLDTVKQVLDVARTDHVCQSLTECFVSQQMAVRLGDDPTLIAPLVDLVQRMLRDMQFGDATERMHLGVALEEALLNAFCHGTFALSPEQVQEMRSGLVQNKLPRCVEEQRSRRSGRARAVTVEVRLSRDESRFVVHDEGSGFTRSAVPRRNDPASLERGRGRGLVLMENFVDEVMFNESGNEVTLVKRRL